ncbi:diguanylate cyclase [Mesobacillus subterraneus]|uniref:GGDEF domain-containing response regulator n=1 Tax=Mesobacillus subterraneus TaxID=285983 RepID=UPI00273CF58C|nr:diguanylate cyclase [Mesobacillus subterraneus]WLR54046.1 diguanylate cyclase [Mesobacillus subterraneus]
MALEKYQKLLFEKIKQKISWWFDNQPAELVDNEEVYRFLHSIKGTSGTIHLGGLHFVSSTLLERLEAGENMEWEKDELRDFLFELISLSYEYEHFRESDFKKSEPCCDNLPLIQIIDDDVTMLILLKEALEDNGWMVMTNTEPEKAVSLYYDLQPDCLVIDVDLPSKNGFQLLESIQEHNHKQFIPKVVISTQTDRNTRMNAYEMGADDFIEKPIDMEEFIVRINRQLQRKQIFDQSVLIDELTQVYNRRFLFDQLDRYLKDFERKNAAFSIGVLDLDHFKKINDTFGHLTGDKVLEAFALFLKQQTRSTDIVFRYGGEEFIVLFPNTNDQEASEVARRILEEFSKVEFEVQGRSFHVSFSAGIYMVNKPTEGSLDILKKSDQALYKAKEKGRACVESANETMLPATKILNVSVIDDDAIIRTLLVRVLQNIDADNVVLNIESYENGEMFFEAGRLECEGKHFLILDGVMPVMDGIEVLSKVKSTENASQVNVLMLTGRKTEYDIARALKLGADDYVTKPFSITELQARIQRLIQRMF